MNNKSFIIVSTLWMIVLGNCLAADFVQFPSGDAIWNVTIRASSSAAGKVAIGRQPQQVLVTQLGGQKRIQIKWSDGKQTEIWGIPGLPVKFQEDPRNGDIISVQNGSTMEAFQDFYATYDQFSFDWIRENNLIEKDPVDHGGKQCYHYKGSASPPYSTVVFLREAWIDSTTKVPVEYDNGVSVSSYIFTTPPPDSKLDMSPAFKRAIKYFRVTMGY